MSKNILIKRVLIQVDNDKPFLTSVNGQFMYTEMLPTDLNKHKKINSMSQLLDLYKYIPNAYLTKTFFGNQNKIIISSFDFNMYDISITEKFFKKHTLTLHFIYEPYEMTLKEVINTFNMDTAIEIISDRLNTKVDTKILKEFL